MATTRDDVEADPRAREHQGRAQSPSRAQRVLGWATAAAILLGGMNALVQMIRVAIGH